MATPFWLSENIFDEIGAAPDSLVRNPNNNDAPGHEAWRVADGLRDRTWWTPTVPNVEHALRSSSAAARTVDTIVLDRGHNLGGTGYAIRSFNSAGAFAGTVISGTIRAAVGGLPTDMDGCRTPTGEWWKVFSSSTAFGHEFAVAAMGVGVVPIVPGLAMGRAYRWPDYFDAPSALDDRRRVSWAVNRESEAGVRVRRGRRVHRRLDLRIQLNAEQWTPALQAEFARVVDRGLPVWHCTDDGTAAGAAALGLFHVADDVDFDPVQNPVHRELQLELDEVAPVQQR